jgi:hypothetical protein
MKIRVLARAVPHLWPLSFPGAFRMFSLSVADADCGFSSQALYKTKAHPTVICEKFKAMQEGAEIASKQLWH